MTADHQPDAPAVEGPSTWSYGKLDATASHVAASLLSHGVEAGDRVAVCLGKSPETVAVLFGILRAGAVFVPLDPTAPAARLAAILSNCTARTIVCEAPQRDAVVDMIPLDRRPSFAVTMPSARGPKEPAGVQPAIPSVPWAQVLSTPVSEFHVARQPTDLAYILYTSGSTGTPKGVMISHENALAFTSWARRRFGVSPADRVTSVAPFHFDLSTFDLYSTLEGGGTVLLVPRQTALFPAALTEFLEASRATITYLVPSTLSSLVLRGDLAERNLQALRTILFAGEVLSPRSLAMLMDALPHTALFNLYGPTETNVCTYYEVLPQDRDREDPVPIGVPASRDAIFAIDEKGDLVTEAGARGEICASGPTVALGYWGDPDLSGRLFLDQHPHAPPGWRTYRTGDIGSLGESGQWMYHGRRDHQIKLRGYRIELGEIEAALISHPAVAESAAVVVREPEEESEGSIRGYVSLREGVPPPDAPALKRHCSERLPRYMVPESIEFLPALPKTSTGKVDRPALGTRQQRLNRR